MMRTFLLSLALLLAGCALRGEPEPEGRTTVGNGGGDDPFEGNALFLGKSPVRVCLHPSADASATELKEYIGKAFSVWRNYLAEHAVNDANLHPERAGLPERFHLHMNHTIVECDEAPELEVFFGETTHSSITRLRETKYIGKAGFLHPTSFSTHTGRGHAYLWVASPGRLRPEFQNPTGHAVWAVGNLVHELGHALGCGHVPGTLMSNSFYAYLSAIQRKKPSSDHLVAALSPDQRNELLICQECAFYTDSGMTSASTQNAEIVFNLFLGQELKEYGRYGIELARPRTGGALHLLARPWDEDSQDLHLLPIQNLRMKSKRLYDIPVFKVSWAEGKNPVSTIESFQQSLGYEGLLRTLQPQASEVKVEIQRNTAYGVIELSIPDFESIWTQATHIKSWAGDIEPNTPTARLLRDLDRK